jgi:hypothetical protein
MEIEKNTTFFDINGEKMGDDFGILPIPLYKGMIITMEGYGRKQFEVVDWNYHHGHPIDNAGLRIILKEKL